MKGFFHPVKKEVPQKEKKARGTRSPSVQTIKKLDCETCGLYKNCLSPRMEITGQGRKKILIIAEAPGKTEDEKGIQLVGDAGQLLRKILSQFNIDLDLDCWKTNACRCRPEKNKTPSNTEIACCRAYLFKDINELKPKKIIVLGKTALQAIIGEDKAITSIEKYVGWAIPDQILKTWIFPTYHPSYLLRNSDDVVLKNLFSKHLKQAILYNKEFPDYSEDKKKVQIITNPFAAAVFIDGLKAYKNICFDIETTGKKPHAPGHRIVSIAFSVDSNSATAFPFFDDPDFKEAIRKLMTNKKIKKIAQNMKFEDTWMRFFGFPVSRWHYDTMQAAHILDNRTGITGLKDQVYFHFGVRSYNDTVEPFLKSSEKSANAFNKIDLCPMDDLLLYNGLDAMYEMRLAEIQDMESMLENDAYLLFHKGIEELSIVEDNGIKINKEYYHDQTKHLQRKMEKLEKQILSSREVEQWEEHKPDKFKGKEFNFNSDQQLRILLFDILDYPKNKLTKGENASVDQEVLEDIDSAFTKKILEHGKLSKLKETYIGGFLREEVNEIIHPTFSLNIARTYRPSTKDPNFANIPKRDKYALEVVRSGIVPSKGNMLMEVDYGQIEVRVAACYNKDPVMIEYCTDPTTDMHRDEAMKLFILEKDEIPKELRHLAKNKFVFPEFYGDYYASCASNIWKELTPEWKNHLKQKGIGSYIKFENHVKKVEDIFWNKHFKGYSKWKKNMWEDFQKTGKIFSHTGFTYQGHMSRKDASNYPIQGSAFHCMLWSLIKINQYLRKNAMKTKIINQIYDALLFDLDPKEKNILKPVIKKIMTEDVRKAFSWIIVPLTVEAEISKIDGNWYEMCKEEI